MDSKTVPAGPPGHRLLGNAPQLSSDRLGCMTRWSREYGDIVPLRFGPFRAFLLNHPELIGEVLINQHHNFIRLYVVRQSRLTSGNSMLALTGDRWRRKRRLAQPAFHRQAVALYAEWMVSYTERMLDRWRDGQRRDIHQEMMRLTLAVVVRSLFDADVESEAPSLREDFKVVLENFTARMDSGVPYPDTLPTPRNFRLRLALRRIDAVIYRVIAEARAGNEQHAHLVSLLLRARDEDGQRLSDRELRDETMAFFLAGHETTALALTWTLYLLSQHPDVAARLYKELQTVLDGRAPGPADMRGLSYTEKVLRESMRLYPPAYALARDSVADCEIGGWHIPARSTVIVSQWVMHRDPRYWDRPDEFDPDRWTDDLVRGLPRFAYFPFGGGQHLCISAPFAMLEATIMLAMIAKRFRLQLVSGHQAEPQPLITLRPRDGMPMILHERSGLDAPWARTETRGGTASAVTMPERSVGTRTAR